MGKAIRCNRGIEFPEDAFYRAINLLALRLAESTRIGPVIQSVERHFAHVCAQQPGFWHLIAGACMHRRSRRVLSCRCRLTGRGSS